VHGIPIDYDPALYAKARSVSGGSDEKLFEDYFDSQYQMLLTLKPRVVGHFDLIRLMSDLPNRDLRELKGVWERIIRNLKVIVEQSGLVEVNSSGLRKGLLEPYPSRSVCEEYLKLGGKLTLSDDSHGVKQVGTNYVKAMGYLDSLGVEVLYTLDRKDEEAGKMTASVRKMNLRSAKESFKE
jgi:histidinol-phosphatase (PHP family)